MKRISQPQREFRVVAAGVFKATCLNLLDEVYANRNLSIIVTKRGKPVGQLIGPTDDLKLTVTVQSDNISALQAEARAAFEKHGAKKKDKKKKHK